MVKLIMPNNYSQVLPIEKIISVLSYISFGIVGIIWLITAGLLKKRLRYFLMYNIVQSVVISVLYAFFNLLLDTIFKLLALIPFLGMIIAKLNLFLTQPLIKIFFMSFSVIPLIITVLLIYIIVGVILGRIFYVPGLTSIINKAMKSY